MNTNGPQNSAHDITLAEVPVLIRLPRVTIPADESPATLPMESSAAVAVPETDPDEEALGERNARQELALRREARRQRSQPTRGNVLNSNKFLWTVLVCGLALLGYLAFQHAGFGSRQASNSPDEGTGPTPVPLASDVPLWAEGSEAQTASAEAPTETRSPGPQPLYFGGESPESGLSGVQIGSPAAPGSNPGPRLSDRQGAPNFDGLPGDMTGAAPGNVNSTPDSTPAWRPGSTGPAVFAPADGNPGSNPASGTNNLAPTTPPAGGSNPSPTSFGPAPRFPVTPVSPSINSPGINSSGGGPTIPSGPTPNFGPSPNLGPAPGGGSSFSPASSFGPPTTFGTAPNIPGPAPSNSTPPGIGPAPALGPGPVLAPANSNPSYPQSTPLPASGNRYPPNNGQYIPPTGP